MIQIYRSALRYFVRSLPILLAVAAVVEGLKLALAIPGFPRELISFAVWLLVTFELAYYVHRHFLYPGPRPWGRTGQVWPAARTGWFLAACIAVWLVAAVLAVALAFKLGADRHGPSALALTLAFAGLYLALLSLFGMGLPAIVEGNRHYRVISGIKASPDIALGLILGPGLAFGVILGLSLISSDWLSDVAILQGELGQWAINTLRTTLGFLPTILTVAVLCRAYRRDYPPQA